MLRDKVLEQIRDLVRDNKDDRAAVFQQSVELLNKQFPAYDWVGIYLVEGGELVLAAWKGAHATEHTRIPMGQGVCGAAAASGQTEIVSNVSQDKRYLACFSSTKSEIVVPIKSKNKVIGEIDIDSDKLAVFNQNDRVFLEEVASLLSGIKR